MNTKKALEAAVLAGRLTLENGGEVYRAEEVILKMCQGLGCSCAEVLVMPTGIFATVMSKQGDIVSLVARIKHRQVNLNVMELVNTLSRRVYSGELTNENALSELTRLRSYIPRPKWQCVLLGSFSSALFSLLAGGGLFDFFAAMVSGAVAQFILQNFRWDETYSFVTGFISGGVLVGLSTIISVIFHAGSPTIIATGGLLPMLPGLLMVNAVRDTMHGDLVSGGARGLEALMMAAALASGGGLFLKIWVVSGGGI